MLRPATARLLERLFDEPIAALLASPATSTDDAENLDPEQEALELARRVAASDVGQETVSRLELVVDDLATGYPVTAPAELLVKVRRHLGYVARLFDARKTLEEHHRLLVTAGWLSLLAATLHIDLKQPRAAAGWLATVASLARHTGHEEIHAWRYETEAWQMLTDGDYRRALELSQTAQRIAPRGSTAAIQATAQEGRAWARLGEPRDTYIAIDRVHVLAGSLPRPDRPEHHYRYDPTKAVAYTATTLAWVGEPAAEGFAREVITQLRGRPRSGAVVPSLARGCASGGGPRPVRRRRCGGLRSGAGQRSVSGADGAAATDAISLEAYFYTSVSA